MTAIPLLVTLKLKSALLGFFDLLPCLFNLLVNLQLRGFQPVHPVCVVICRVAVTQLNPTHTVLVIVVHNTATAVVLLIGVPVEEVMAIHVSLVVVWLVKSKNKK